jgi:hypothetical protein
LLGLKIKAPDGEIFLLLMVVSMPYDCSVSLHYAPGSPKLKSQKDPPHFRKIKASGESFVAGSLLQQYSDEMRVTAFLISSCDFSSSFQHPLLLYIKNKLSHKIRKHQTQKTHELNK